MDAEVSTHTFLTMIIEESVCFMSCEPFFLGAIILMWYTWNIFLTCIRVRCNRWPVYLRSGPSNRTKIGPLGQLIFLSQQLSLLPTGRFFILPCHSISTDNRLMKFPDKTLKFNFDHSPKAINSLITQSACVYLNLLPYIKRILTEIYAGNQYFIIQ